MSAKQENMYAVAKKLATADGSISDFYITKENEKGEKSTYLDTASLINKYINKMEYRKYMNKYLALTDSL